MDITAEGHERGRPAWVDLMVSDLERSTGFYRAVLGWDYRGEDGTYGGYRSAVVDGQQVAGLMPYSAELGEPNFTWTTYLSSDDAAADARLVTDAGGALVMGPEQLGPLGTMAICADSTGVPFGLWQAGQQQGFERFMARGAVTWSEAVVGDVDKAMDFYATVFGFRYQEYEGADMRYAMAYVGEEPESMFGAVTETGGLSGEPHWHTTFGVDDVDAAAAAAASHGGQVRVEPFDFEFGRIADLVGPDGEVFGILRGTEPPA